MASAGGYATWYLTNDGKFYMYGKQRNSGRARVKVVWTYNECSAHTIDSYAYYAHRDAWEVVEQGKATVPLCRESTVAAFDAARNKCGILMSDDTVFVVSAELESISRLLYKPSEQDPVAVMQQWPVHGPGDVRAPIVLGKRGSMLALRELASNGIVSIGCSQGAVATLLTSGRVVMWGESSDKGRAGPVLLVDESNEPVYIRWMRLGHSVSLFAGVDGVMYLWERFRSSLQVTHALEGEVEMADVQLRMIVYKRTNGEISTALYPSQFAGSRSVVGAELVPGENGACVSDMLGKDVVHVAAGFRHALACSSNTVYCWGNSTHGQCGRLPGKGGHLSVQGVNAVELPHPVCYVAGGRDHSLALCVNGDLYAWGRNDKGQCGKKSVGNGAWTM